MDEAVHVSQTNVIYIGVGGSVLALDRSTGNEIWRSKLKGGDFVNVDLQGGDVFATTKGELFCLDAATGTIRWQNPLKGLGTGFVTIAASGTQQGVIMNQKKQIDDAAATVVTTT